MTNEDRQRTMDFILSQQAQFAAGMQRLEEGFQQLEEERIRDRPRLAELEKSFQTVVRLLENYDSRQDRLESRTTALETNMAALAAAQAHADERLSALIDVVRQDRDRAS